MQILRRVAVLLAALALCAPAASIAQESTLPQSGSGVSTQPPVELGGDEPRAEAKDVPQPSGLPSTGSDPRLLFLVGAAVLLLGVGLRLRTADAELY